MCRGLDEELLLSSHTSYTCITFTYNIIRYIVEYISLDILNKPKWLLTFDLILFERYGNGEKCMFRERENERNR